MRCIHDSMTVADITRRKPDLFYNKINSAGARWLEHRVLRRICSNSCCKVRINYLGASLGGLAMFYAGYLSQRMGYSSMGTVRAHYSNSQSMIFDLSAAQ
jgi:hypothetical protein